MSLDKTPVSGFSESSSFANGETLTMPICPSCGMKMAHGTVKCPNDGTEIVTNFKAGDCLSDKYEFLESIGSGGMGIIYKARHLGLNKIVAIKLLHPYLLNAETVMRFQREARTASMLRHPNLITVQDIGTTDDGQPFMVMDYVSGQSLSELIKEKGRLTVPETVGIFVQICSGLAFAHKQNILHRDLKPSNIMLFYDDQAECHAKILDFGIAKVLDDSDKQASTLTKTGDVFGSPLYMSPEQGAGGKVDRRSDCYSLGCMLFECLTGTTPFMGRSIIETLMAHAQQKAPSLKEASLGLEFPKALDDIVAKLLAKAPDERYQSVLEVREDLQSLQANMSDSSSAESSEPNLSRRELRQLAGSDGSASGAKRSASKILDIKNVAIVLLSIAVLVLLVKDFAPNFKMIEEAPSKSSMESAERLKTTFGSPSEGGRAEAQSSIRKQLQKQNNPEKIELEGCGLIDSDLIALKNHTVITGLDLQSNSIMGTGLSVAQTLPNLYKLNLSENPLTDEGLRTISALAQVRNIEMKGVTFGPSGLYYIGQMKNMEKLEFDGAYIEDKHLKFLSGLPNLKELSINDQDKMSDRNISVIESLPSLTAIDLSNTKVTGEGFEKPQRFPKLDTIVLKHNKLTEEGILKIVRIKNLKDLDIRDARFNVKWLSHLRTVRGFRKLQVSNHENIASIRELLPHCEIEWQKEPKRGFR